MGKKTHVGIAVSGNLATCCLGEDLKSYALMNVSVMGELVLKGEEWEHNDVYSNIGIILLSGKELETYNYICT